MYEKEYWWFEIIVMITKQIMTGALGVLKPGTRKCKRTDVMYIYCPQETAYRETLHNSTDIYFVLALAFFPFQLLTILTI